MSKKYILDGYEQEIEDNLEKFSDVPNQEKLKKTLQKAAKAHLHSKKPITIRIPFCDIEAIKIKASKLGLPYQTYINMLIHKDVTQA